MNAVIFLLVLAGAIYAVAKMMGGDGKPSLRDQQVAEARALWDEVANKTFPDGALVRELGYAVADDHAPELRNPIRVCIDSLIITEQVRLDEPDFDNIDLVELAQVPRMVDRRKYKLSHGQEDFEGVMLYIINKIQDTIPKTSAPSPFNIPYIYTFPEVKSFISILCARTLELSRQDIFFRFSDKLYNNACRASGIDPSDTKNKKPIRLPNDTTLPLGEINDVYLRGTPLHQLFATPVPLKLTHEDRYNHMHILGGTGAGKSTLIENLIRHDLDSDDPPSIVLIDPHGDLIGKIARENAYAYKRFIIIDPRDVEYPPALNIFALNQKRLAGYDAAMREQVVAGVIETYEYLFAGFGVEMTGKQQVLFRNACRLLITLPDAIGRNATIIDMLRLMKDLTPYVAAIELLPPTAQEFFIRDYPSKDFASTREQIRYRLQAILENPTMARLFTATETKVDLFDALNSGAVILVHTAKDFLKGSSSLFGRLFISLILQAVMERSVIAKHKRKATFIYVDEAASYFDTNISDILTEVRKYHCGLILAHQFLDQATPALRSAMNANTGIKFASGTSATDARVMATEMRTTADFILDQPRYQFAAYIKGVTPQAISIPVTEPAYREAIDAESFGLILDMNRNKVSLGPPPKLLPQEPIVPPEPALKPKEKAAKPTPTALPTPPIHNPPEDISTNW